MKKGIKKWSSLLFGILLGATSNAQVSSCSYEAIISRQTKSDQNYLQELEENERLTLKFIESKRSSKNRLSSDRLYVIPVVLHVFHSEDEGMIDLEQAQSGIDIINEDFNGLNVDWNLVDPRFDSIKSKLSIRFCLAAKDPQGQPTSGVIYYEDDKSKNNSDLLAFAWDNYKYLNIYLRKSIFGEPSNFSGYTDYPSTTNSDNGRDGIFMSSVRWGFGANSELEVGDEWASVATHEVGHWLNLFHTFDNGCSSTGDKVSDTPSTMGGDLFLSGCDNNDMTCGESTNGENYMDYNLRCRKMFTQGQVDRMEAALHFSTRKTLWSMSNLIETGCDHLLPITPGNEVKVFPVPASDYVYFKFTQPGVELKIFNIDGKLIFSDLIVENEFKFNVSELNPGLFYFIQIQDQTIHQGKFIVR